MWKYKVRNNENNRTLWVCATWNDDHLEQITKNLMGIPNDNFWNSKKQEEQLLKDLTTSNPANIKERPTTNKQKPKTFIEKIKYFTNFWVSILRKS